MGVGGRDGEWVGIAGSVRRQMSVKGSWKGWFRQAEILCKLSKVAGTQHIAGGADGTHVQPNCPLSTQKKQQCRAAACGTGLIKRVQKLRT